MWSNDTRVKLGIAVMSASLTCAAVAAVTVEGPVEVACDEGANYGDAWFRWLFSTPQERKECA